MVPVLRSCQSPTWIRLVNYLHLHLHSTRVRARLTRGQFKRRSQPNRKLEPSHTWHGPGALSSEDADSIDSVDSTPASNPADASPLARAVCPASPSCNMLTLLALSLSALAELTRRCSWVQSGRPRQHCEVAEVAPSFVHIVNKGMRACIDTCTYACIHVPSQVMDPCHVCDCRPAAGGQRCARRINIYLYIEIAVSSLINVAPELMIGGQLHPSFTASCLGAAEGSDINTCMPRMAWMGVQQDYVRRATSLLLPACMAYI